MRKHIAIIIPSIMLCALIVAGCVIPQPTPTVSPISPVVTPAIVAVKSPTPKPTPDGGFLMNSSMEMPYTCADNMCVPQYWHGWTQNPWPCRPLTPGCDLPCPSTCLNDNGKCNYDTGCTWAAAEITNASQQYPYRVHSGEQAVNIFARARLFNSGLYQQFYHVPMGSLLRFSVWAQGWQCASYINCQWGELSDIPANMNLQVGIDPFGGTDPYTNTIVWSVPVESFDHWSQIEVSAVAMYQVVTVYVRAAPRWEWPRNDGNNAYFDDAHFDVVPPTPPVTPTPSVTPTPFSATNWVYLPAIMRQ